MKDPMITRFFGAVLMAGSLAVMVNSFIPGSTSGGIPLLLWSIGGVCGILGLLRLDALGTNAVARALGFIPVLGFATLLVNLGLEVAGFYKIGDPLNNTLATIAWIGILAGMLIVGILVIAAKTWKGWQRFVPLSTIVAVPIGLGIGAAVRNTQIGGALIFLVFFVLGYVISTMESPQAARQAVA
jgi:hypothetical protein